MASSPAIVNAASRLAMLAERMGKLNAQVGRDVLAVRSRRALAESSAEFERGLGEVTAVAVSAELRDNYRLLRLLWNEFRPLALQAPSPDAARRLGERTEEVAWIAAKGARILHEQAWSRAGELVMFAGSARAGAQRLGRLHLARGWALGSNAAAADIKRTEGDVVLALEELKPETRGDASSSVQMAESQLGFLRQAVERLAQGKERPTQLEHIAKSTDYVADTMDRVAKDYEEARG
jgi:hypothetical protein